MPALQLPDPPLTDGEIVLRAWQRGDASAVAAACQDPEIPRWTVVPHNYTRRHARDFISGTGTDLASGRELALAIVDREDQLLGALGISNFDWVDLKAEIGYWIAAGARRRGIGARHANAGRLGTQPPRPRAARAAGEPRQPAIPAPG